MSLALKVRIRTAKLNPAIVHSRLVSGVVKKDPNVRFTNMHPNEKFAFKK